MKLSKFLLFAICMANLNSKSIAQPVISSSMPPLPAGTSDSIYGAIPSVVPGVGGAGVTWDLSTLTPIAQGVVNILNPSTTPYYSTFPTSNFCAQLDLTTGGTSYIYERVSSSKWEQLAHNYAGVGTGDDYTPNQESSLKFPMNYLDAFTDTFEKTTGGPNTVDITYDGYGTLITPFGTYTNVVRIYKYWGPGDYAYNWYTTTPYLSIVAVFDMQTNAYTLIGHATTTGVDEVSNVETAILFPNPVENTTTLKIKAPAITNASLIIADAVGKIVRQIPINSAETTIPKDGLSKGIYFYSLLNNNVKIANGKLVVN